VLVDSIVQRANWRYINQYRTLPPDMTEYIDELRRLVVEIESKA